MSVICGMTEVALDWESNDQGQSWSTADQPWDPERRGLSSDVVCASVK